MKAVVDDRIPFIRGQVERLVDEAVYLPGSGIARADVADADILVVRTRTRCDRALLEGSRVRLVVTATIGFDHIDADYLRRAGIAWASCPGCNASSVRQYVHNALLALGYLRPPACAGLTAGVVGVGHVGSLVAADLAAAGMRVLRCDPPLADAAGGREGGAAEFHTLAEVAARCDIVTFHTPLTREGRYPTFHMAGADFFRSLARRPLLINTSRGAVVDNAALVEALDGGMVRDAVVDVWEGEPDISPELLRRAVVATPHVAGYSADGKANATRMALQAVARFLRRPFAFRVEPPPLPDGYAYGGAEAQDEPCAELRLYDPRVDSRRLKAHPGQFEQLRGNYPLRREAAEGPRARFSGGMFGGE